MFKRGSFVTKKYYSFFNTAKKEKKARTTEISSLRFVPAVPYENMFINITHGYCLKQLKRVLPIMEGNIYQNYMFVIYLSIYYEPLFFLIC
jgi:hypothetical protein